MEHSPTPARVARAASADRDGVPPEDAAILAGVSHKTIMLAWRSGDLAEFARGPLFAPDAVRAWARAKRLIA